MIKAKSDEALSGKIALTVICVAALVITFIRYKDELASSGLLPAPMSSERGKLDAADKGTGKDGPEESGASDSGADRRGSASSQKGDTGDINIPGLEVDIKRHAVSGKYTIIDFWSPYCPPCMMIKPFVEKLAAARKDIAVREVNINRPDVRGIDWVSPVARQYDLHAVPHFKIFGPDRKLIAENEPATKMVLDWIRELEESGKLQESSK